MNNEQTSKNIFTSKEGGPNFLGGFNSADRLSYLVPFLYFNFKNLKNPNSSSIIRFQYIVHDSGEPFLDSWSFYKLKRGDVISWGGPIFQNSWIIWALLLYFNFKSFKDPNFPSFIRFQCILHDSGALFSDF